jgi:hypothetical protein
LRRGARLTLSIGFVCPAGVIIFGVAGLGDVVDWARQQVASRVPKADLDQRDPDYIRDQFAGPVVAGVGVLPRRRERFGPDPARRYMLSCLAIDGRFGATANGMTAKHVDRLFDMMLVAVRDESQPGARSQLIGDADSASQP